MLYGINFGREVDQNTLLNSNYNKYGRNYLYYYNRGNKTHASKIHLGLQAISSVYAYKCVYHVSPGQYGVTCVASMSQIYNRIAQPE